MATHAEALPLGDPMSGQVAIGPIINQTQVDHARKVLDDSVVAGATVAAVGTSNGLFFKATVLTGVRNEMPAFTDEIFGPVAVIVPFDSDDQAVALANDTEYGLSAAIITRDVGRGMAIGDRLQAGLIHINDQTVNDDVVNPFGGVGASGNGTSIGGPASWEEFTHWQWTTIKGTPPAMPSDPGFRQMADAWASGERALCAGPDAAQLRIGCFGAPWHPMRGNLTVDQARRRLAGNRNASSTTSGDCRRECGPRRLAGRSMSKFG